MIRSINTSIVALLPVAAILFVGAGLLGAGTLKDLALALFVGMAAGTYSSICVATPFLVQIKNREPEIQALERRVLVPAPQGRRRRGRREPRRMRPPEPAQGCGGAVSRTVTESGVRNQPKRQARSKRKPDRLRCLVD